jgi:hypothetical protein
MYQFFSFCVRRQITLYERLVRAAISRLVERVYRARHFKISTSPGSRRYGGFSGCRVVQRDVRLRVSMPALLSEDAAIENGSEDRPRTTVANSGASRESNYFFDCSQRADALGSGGRCAGTTSRSRLNPSTFGFSPSETGRCVAVIGSSA